MKGVAMIALLLAAGGLIERLSRETNSLAAARRGVANFEKGAFPAAVEALSQAAAIAPGPLSAYNLGTAQVAAGQNQEGSATLDQAVSDPQIRPDALFNRGNSALNAKAFEAAIRDYSDVLRLRPNDAAAKRNLEIALRRQESSPRQAPQQEPQQNGDDGQQPERGSPGDRDAEALLRSVEQQEREELSRMRQKSPSTRRIGW